MRCMKCFVDLPEKEIQLSHDIPKYMGGVDLDGRHWLCKECHEKYEKKVLIRCLTELGIELDIEKPQSYYMVLIRDLDNNSKNICKEIAKRIKEKFFEVGDGRK